MVRRSLGRLTAKLNSKKGWIIFFLAIFISVGIGRVTQDGIPFLGGGSGHSHVSFVELTRSNFQAEMSKATGPIFVEIGDGSADSQAQQIVLDQAVDQFGGKVTFFRVNATTEPAVANVFDGVVTQFLQTQGASVPPTGLPRPLHLLFSLGSDGTPKILNVGAGVMGTGMAQQWIADGLSGKAMQPADSSTPTTPTTPGTATPKSTPAAPSSPTTSTSGS